MIYLSSPYSHKDYSVRQKRYKEASKCMVHFLEYDPETIIFSPIMYGRILESCLESCLQNSFSHEKWMRIDLSILDHCEEMWILCIDGWKESKVIKKEIEFCKENGIPMYFVIPNGNEYEVTLYE